MSYFICPPTGPFVYTYHGVSDWWNSLETSSSTEDVVQKADTRGAQPPVDQDDLDYLTTTTNTETKVISDEAVPGQRLVESEEGEDVVVASTSGGQTEYEQLESQETRGNFPSCVCDWNLFTDTILMLITILMADKTAAHPVP